MKASTEKNSRLRSILAEITRNVITKLMAGKVAASRLSVADLKLAHRLKGAESVCHLIPGKDESGKVHVMITRCKRIITTLAELLDSQKDGLNLRPTEPAACPTDISGEKLERFRGRKMEGNDLPDAE